MSDFDDLDAYDGDTEHYMWVNFNNYENTGSPDVFNETDLLLVGYYNSEQLEAIKKNRLYYVPTAFGKGSINLVSCF